MATVIDALIVSLGLDPKDFVKGSKDTEDRLRKTNEAFTKTAKEIQTRGKQAQEFFAGVRKEVTALFTAFAGGVGIANFLFGTTKMNTNLGFMAANMRTSAQELFAWQRAVESVGGTADEASQSLANIANMQALQRQRPDLFAPFARYLAPLGLSGREFQEGDPAHLLLEIIRRASERTHGRRNETLQYLSNLGITPGAMNAGLLPGIDQKLTDYSKFAPTDKDIEEAKAFTEALTRLRSELTKVRNEVLGPMLEPLIALARQFGDFAKKHIPLFVGALATLSAAFVALTAPIWLPLTPLIALGVTISALIDDFITFRNNGKSAFDWGRIVQAVNVWMGELVGWFNKFLREIWPMVNALKDFAKQAFDAAKSSIPGLIEAIKNMAGALGEALGWLSQLAAVLIKAFGPAAAQVLKDGLKVVSDGINLTANIIRTIVALLRGDWKTAWDGARDAAVNAINSIEDSLHGLFNLGYGIGRAINPRIQHNNPPSGAGAPQVPNIGFPVPRAGEGGASPSGLYGGPSALRGLSLAKIKAAADRVTAFFEQHGFTKDQARGIAAGIYAESGLNEHAVNPTSGAFGLGQWLSRDRVQALVSRYGSRPTFDQQLQFMLEEMTSGKNKYAGDAIRASGNARDALSAFVRKFERPAEGFETYGDLLRGSAFLLGYNANDVPRAGAKTQHSQAANQNQKGGTTNQTEVNIGAINIQTQAKDAQGIAKEIRPAISKRAFVQPANVGTF